MRAFLLLFTALALGACAQPRISAVAQPAVARLAGELPLLRLPEAQGSLARFADSAPHAWTDDDPRRHPVHGIDVSHWQGEIDWPRVAASAIAFAYIKATEGGDVLDPRFVANWHGAAAAGLPRGAYHMFYFCRSAAEQAAWFARHLPRDRQALPPVLDMEWTKSRTCPRRPAPETVRAEMRVFLAALARHTGKRPIVYTTVDFYRDNDLGQMAGVDFWLRSTAAHPSVTYPGQSWTFWQHTGTGLVEGITGPTDVNAYAGTPAQWQAWLAANAR